MEEKWLERMRAEKETELNASDITEEDESSAGNCEHTDVHVTGGDVSAS